MRGNSYNRHIQYVTLELNSFAKGGCLFGAFLDPYQIFLFLADE